MGQVFRYQAATPQVQLEQQEKQPQQQMQPIPLKDLSHFTPKVNVNKSQDDLPYFLDPISHQKIYRTTVQRR